MPRSTDKTIKLRDVAKAAGVSQGTASNAFSRPEIVRDEVREHVLKVARELGYAGPSITGRLLRAGRVNAVGVAAIEPLSYFFKDLWARHLMDEISRICDERGQGWRWFLLSATSGWTGTSSRRWWTASSFFASKAAGGWWKSPGSANCPMSP